MSTKRTGTIEPNGKTPDGKPRYRARILLKDGHRPRIPVPDGFSEAEARQFAAERQAEADHSSGIDERRQRPRPTSKKPEPSELEQARRTAMADMAAAISVEIGQFASRFVVERVMPAVVSAAYRRLGEEP